MKEIEDPKLNFNSVDDSTNRQYNFPEIGKIGNRKEKKTNDLSSSAESNLPTRAPASLSLSLFSRVSSLVVSFHVRTLRYVARGRKARELSGFSRGGDDDKQALVARPPRK